MLTQPEVESYRVPTKQENEKWPRTYYGPPPVEPVVTLSPTIPADIRNDAWMKDYLNSASGRLRSVDVTQRKPSWMSGDRAFSSNNHNQLREHRTWSLNYQWDCARSQQLQYVGYHTSPWTYNGLGSFPKHPGQLPYTPSIPPSPAHESSSRQLAIAMPRCEICCGISRDGRNCSAVNSVCGSDGHRRIHSTSRRTQRTSGQRQTRRLTHSKANDQFALLESGKRCKYLGIQSDSKDNNVHVFDNGLRLPTQIQGEPVNPAWGVSRSGRPRKRSAFACINCRKKKTKCVPTESDCEGCIKAGKTCH